MEGTPSSVSQEFTIKNKLGLHARPAAMFVKLTNRFESEIWVEREDETVNGKSIMGLMMLAAGQGAKILVTAEGGDASEAIAAVGELIEGEFQEG